MDKNNLDELIKRVGEMEERILKLEGKTSDQPGHSPRDKKGSKKVSIKEFLLSKKPTNDVQKTLAIAYYLEKLEKYETFNANDLSLGFDRAREKKPINMNDKINMNIRNGHMDPAMEKKDSLKAWHLTNSGESFVEADFSNG